MSIRKTSQPIRTLDEWLIHAGPKREMQWKDGRSAKESARYWLGVESPSLPREVDALLRTNAAFQRCSNGKRSPRHGCRSTSWESLETPICSSERETTAGPFSLLSRRAEARAVSLLRLVLGVTGDVR